MEAEGKLFFDDFFSAHAEAQRRRKFFAESGIIARVEESPYGGYQIRMIPVDMAINGYIAGGNFLRKK